MDKSLIQERIRKIRKRLHLLGVDGMVVTAPSNVTYVTGFMGQDSWALISGLGVYLLTDSRYTEQARQECPLARILERTGNLAALVGDLFRPSAAPVVLGVEPGISIRDLQSLKRQAKTRVLPSPGVVESVRSLKDPWELACLRKAALIVKQALAQTLPMIRPGIMECELAGWLDFHLRRLDALPSFDTIVAFGPNASRPHHRPGRRRLAKVDTCLIDVGARHLGYCSDITRCFCIGRPGARYRAAYEAVRQGQAAALGQVRGGAEIRQVDHVARETLRNLGFPVYGHGTGHGLGLDIHEEPFVKPTTQGVLEVGQVVTIEPGIYLPGEWGIRLEDDVLVTETGCRILTRRSPHTFSPAEWSTAR